MKNNQLTGPIPSWIDTFTEMQLLDLGQNKLTGKIPDELGNVTGLDHLLLNRNQLTGSLPDSFYLLSDLGKLLRRSQVLVRFGYAFIVLRLASCVLLVLILILFY
jgi:hypothetical protein